MRRSTKIPHSRRLAGWYFVSLLVLCVSYSPVRAQYPPSHDPTTMIRNVDGRYWIFTTGQGVWAMSSSNPDFTDWRPEPTPFLTNSWPSWIRNYVTGFGGFFWAPDVIRIGSTYYLYYSCAGEGAPAAIGVATATNLAGPWTDRGMVVAGNNAIDPALLMDGGRLWMSWGNWQTGIDICELSPSTGKRISSITKLVTGQVEGPALLKNGNYYYLFYQRGLCCNGVNSTYYIVVARSTNVTGPYTEERVFLPNRNGNIIGPGHIGYGEGRLTYHFYDGNDNGNAKLMVRSDFGYRNGWPYLGAPPSAYYQFRNRGTGLYLDGMGRTANGEAVGQYANTTHLNSQWEMIDVGGGYSQLRNRGTGLFLDGYGRTTNGEEVSQYANTTHPNSHWAVQQFDGNYSRLQNRGTGLYLDGMGRTANGAAAGQYANTTHPNAQWQLIPVSSSARTAEAIQKPKLEEASALEAFSFYPNPVQETLHIQLGKNQASATARLFNLSGQLMIGQEQVQAYTQLDASTLPRGAYFLEITTPQNVKRYKLIKQ